MIIFKRIADNQILAVEQRPFRQSTSVLLNAGDVNVLFQYCKQKKIGYILWLLPPVCNMC